MIAEAWNILCQLAPWLFLGAALAGALHVLVPPGVLRSSLRGPRGVLRAVVLGVPLPLCSCGVIPTGIGLKNDGAEDGAAMGFLISTPQTGVDSMLVSAAFFGWPFAIFKMVTAAITGVVGGLLAVDTGGEKASTIRGSHSGARENPFWMFWNHALEIIQSIWIWLVIGILISAMISAWIPDRFFESISQYGVFWSMLFVVIVSVPLYVCATASVPIAAVLVAGGLPAAAGIVFLIAGPATNFATICAIFGRFGIRNVIVYLGSILVGSMVGGLLFDWTIGGGVIQTAEPHEHIGWFARACGVSLLLLISYFAYIDLRRLINRLKSPRQRDDQISLELRVEGMSCQNCVNKLEDALRNNTSATSVSVDLPSGRVAISGAVDEQSARDAIESAGFHPVSSSPLTTN